MVNHHTKQTTDVSHYQSGEMSDCGCSPTPYQPEFTSVTLGSKMVSSRPRPWPEGLTSSLKSLVGLGDQVVLGIVLECGTILVTNLSTNPSLILAFVHSFQHTCTCY